MKKLKPKKMSLREARADAAIRALGALVEMIDGDGSGRLPSEVRIPLEKVTVSRDVGITIDDDGNLVVAVVRT